MPARLVARQTITVAADQAGADIGRAALVVSSPRRGQGLAVPPEVWLGDTPEGEPALLWNIPPLIDRDQYRDEREWRTGGTPDQAFWAFLELAGNTEPAAYLTFAQRFGTLGLWPYETQDGKKEFGLDYWVPSDTVGLYTPDRYTVVTADSLNAYNRLKAESRHTALYEPVAEWQRWARWTRAIVELAMVLRRGQFGKREQWASLDLDHYFQPELWRLGLRGFPTDIGWQREQLGGVIQNRYLRWSGFEPAVSWEGDRPTVSLTAGERRPLWKRRASMQVDWPENTLFPALTAQLLAIVTSGSPVAACSLCGRIHQRSRIARQDRAVYCDACRQEATRKASRESVARRRARERGQKGQA